LSAYKVSDYFRDPYNFGNLKDVPVWHFEYDYKTGKQIATYGLADAYFYFDSYHNDRVVHLEVVLNKYC